MNSQIFLSNIQLYTTVNQVFPRGMGKYTRFTSLCTSDSPSLSFSICIMTGPTRSISSRLKARRSM